MWGTRSALMSRYYTPEPGARLFAAPHSAKTDDLGPPTPTDTPSAIAAPVHTVNTHAHGNAFNFQRDAVKMYNVPAGQTDCLDLRAQTDRQGGQVSRKLQGGTNESAFARITLHYFFITAKSSNVVAQMSPGCIKTNQSGCRVLPNLTSFNFWETTEGEVRGVS